MSLVLVWVFTRFRHKSCPFIRFVFFAEQAFAQKPHHDKHGREPQNPKPTAGVFSELEQCREYHDGRYEKY